MQRIYSLMSVFHVSLQNKIIYLKHLKIRLVLVIAIIKDFIWNLNRFFQSSINQQCIYKW